LNTQSQHNKRGHDMKIGIVLLVAVFFGVAQAQAQDESVVEAVVGALDVPKDKAIKTAAWLLKEFPSSGARVDALFPDSIIVDEIPLAVKERVDVPVNFAHKGNAVEKTTFYAGMEVAEVFSWWQNPRKWTLDEYSSVAATLIAGYFAYDQFIASDSAGPPEASGTFSVGPSGVVGDFKGVNGTLTGKFEHRKVEGEETTESTSAEFTITQKP
jgi:hypothetical protein